MRDPFTVLGVAEDADDAEIRRRYLALVRDFPPDRDPDRFREYRAAYDALSDERKRRCPGCAPPPCTPPLPGRRGPPCGP